PLFKQFVPLKKEGQNAEGFSIDPVQDISFRKEAKLLHKYEGRALIVTTSACAMHCRYCFRKNFPYETKEPTFEKELAILRADSSIQEVLLSGGDPLSLSDEALTSLLVEIEQIPHVRRIRFHTRFPIGIPERIDASFLQLLQECKKQIWFVIHSNHPQEFDEDIWQALKKIQKLGIPILNQSVLLKGVNDSVETLTALSEALVDHGVTPYYLHQLDRVQGTSHFEVTEEEGLRLMAAIQKQLPGYGVPKYVREIPGKASKTIL
ncbi:MAG: KamA family radical protein, partial [Chlamydiia bacterium]|nr:KamA family radical protein [Chlamydiia bacterium]